MISLVAPDVRFHRSYLAAQDEFDAAGEGTRDGDGVWVEAPEGDFAGVEFTRAELETPAGFERFVSHRRGQVREDAPRTPGHVPCTFLWVVDDEQPDEHLGSLAIRHRLTPFLIEIGGHIGYSVRPSARGRGIATEALRLSLPLCRDLGMDEVLVTCSEDNLASASVIEANGGVLEDVRHLMRRYWIDLGC